MPGLIPACSTLWFPYGEHSESSLNFQAAVLWYRFFFQTFGFWIMFFVSKGHKSISDAAPCTMNFWSTSEPLQRLSTTRTGRCCSCLCSTKVCPPAWDTLPAKTLKDLVSDTSNDKLTCWKLQPSCLQNQPRISIMLWTLWGKEMHQLHADWFWQIVQKANWKVLKAQHRVLIVTIPSAVNCPELVRLGRSSLQQKHKEESWSK